MEGKQKKLKKKFSRWKKHKVVSPQYATTTESVDTGKTATPLETARSDTRVSPARGNRRRPREQSGAIPLPNGIEQSSSAPPTSAWPPDLKRTRDVDDANPILSRAASVDSFISSSGGSGSFSSSPTISSSSTSSSSSPFSPTFLSPSSTSSSFDDLDPLKRGSKEENEENRTQHQPRETQQENDRPPAEKQITRELPAEELKQEGEEPQEQQPSKESTAAIPNQATERDEESKQFGEEERRNPKFNLSNEEAVDASSVTNEGCAVVQEQTSRGMIPRNPVLEATLDQSEGSLEEGPQEPLPENEDGQDQESGSFDDLTPVWGVSGAMKRKNAGVLLGQRRGPEDLEEEERNLKNKPASQSSSPPPASRNQEAQTSSSRISSPPSSSLNTKRVSFKPPKKPKNGPTNKFGNLTLKASRIKELVKENLSSTEIPPTQQTKEVANFLADLRVNIHAIIWKWLESEKANVRSDFLKRVLQCYTPTTGSALRKENADEIQFSDEPAVLELSCQFLDLMKTNPSSLGSEVMEFSNAAIKKFCDDDSKVEVLSFPYLDVISQRFDYYINVIEGTLQRLQRDRKAIFNGKAKAEMSGWWLNLITQKINYYLEDLGYDHEAVPADYTQTKPRSFDGVRFNLKIIEAVLKKEENNFGVKEFISSLTEEIYPKIDSFVNKSLFLLCEKLKIDYDEFVQISKTVNNVKKENEANQNEKNEKEKTAEESGTVELKEGSDDPGLVLIQNQFASLKHDAKSWKDEPEMLDWTDKLIKDVVYLRTMKELEGKTDIRELHVVPVTGLIVSTFVRFENELKTVLLIWEPKPKDTKLDDEEKEAKKEAKKEARNEFRKTKRITHRMSNVGQQDFDWKKQLEDEVQQHEAQQQTSSKPGHIHRSIEMEVDKFLHSNGIDTKQIEEKEHPELINLMFYKKLTNDLRRCIDHFEETDSQILEEVEKKVGSENLVDFDTSKACQIRMFHFVNICENDLQEIMRQKMDFMTGNIKAELFGKWLQEISKHLERFLTEDTKFDSKFDMSDFADLPIVKNNIEVLKVILQHEEMYQSLLKSLQDLIIPEIDCFLETAKVVLCDEFDIEEAEYELEEVKNSLNLTKHIADYWPQPEMIDWIEKMFQDMDTLEEMKGGGIQQLIEEKFKNLEEELQTLVGLWGE